MHPVPDNQTMTSMNADPTLPESIIRINHELRRATGAERRLSITATPAAFAISDACTTFRRVRADLTDYMAWLEVHARDLAPLVQLLIQIADAACRVRGGKDY